MSPNKETVFQRFENVQVTQSLLLAVELFFGSGGLQSCRLTREFEFRSSREVLNVILQVIRTGQGLAVERDLTTCCGYKT